MEFVAIYQSAHPKAEEEAQLILDALHDGGINLARTRVEDEPGGGVRSYLVEVVENAAYDAQALLQAQGLQFEGLDEASSLDFQVAFYSDRHDADAEALTVKSLLEANGISAFLAESSQLPIFPSKVLVPRAEALRARHIIEEAKATGPMDAESAAAGSVEIV